MPKGGYFRISSEYMSFLMKKVDTYFKKGRVVTIPSGGFRVGGARGKTKKGGLSDDVITLSQP